jgi:aldehyde dehydrogenase (NAD+)
VLIQQGIYEPLLKRLSEAFSRLQVGSASMNLDLGPLIRASQLERVTGFLDQAKADGIATVAQGKIAAGVPAGGFYQAPTLLRDVPVMHRLAQEEVFGPVLSAMSFTDEDHAVELANATEFGLVAGIWTRDGGRQFRMAKRVRSGQVFINNYGAGGGVELPFGGVKSSGYGREKGFEALLGFTTLKTVAIQHG